MKITKGEFGKAKICSIGVKTTKTLEILGVNVDITAEVSTVKGLCDAVLNVPS